VKLLVIDNHDSFTYSLVQYLRELGADVEVVVCDAGEAGRPAERDVAGLVISPGPGRPEGAGASLTAVRAFAESGRPVLGVCLGHQAVGVCFGARVRRARRPLHGRTSAIDHAGRGVLRGLPRPFRATRYHSLVVDETDWPQALEVTARDEDGEVMGVRHRWLPAEGVQFHPESVLSEAGRPLLANFLETCEEARGT